MSRGARGKESDKQTERDREGLIIDGGERRGGGRGGLHLAARRIK